MKKLLPTLWRYFLAQYIKVFCLSLFAFLVILLSTKLQDFAQFVSMGAPLSLVTMFIIYQIPYILQIALPISCLIATIYLFQRLTQNNSLTAARASGISLLGLITPILIFSLLLSLITFHYILDLGASSHLAAKVLEHELRSLHPLAIFQNRKLLEGSGITIDMHGSLERDKEASHFIMTGRHGAEGRGYLLIAKKLKLQGEVIRGRELTFITSESSKVPGQFDNVIIETTKENEIPLKDLSSLINKKRFRLGDDDLTFSLLQAKREILKQELINSEYFSLKSKQTKKSYARCTSEIARRVSLSLSIITFGILGIAYGIGIGRVHSKKKIFQVALFTALFLICYLAAKAFETNTTLSTFLYLIPHPIILGFCLKRLHNIEHGLEG